VQVGGAELGQVVEPVGQRTEGAAEAVDVADVALHPGPLEPARVDLAPAVEPAQVGGAVGRRGERGAQRAGEQRVDVGVRAVEDRQRLVDVDERDPDAGEEGVRLVGSQGGGRLVGEDRPQRAPGVFGGRAPAGVRADHR
jgi:hypothetical protein